MGQDGSQSSGSGPAQKAKEDSFGLIVLRVTGCDLPHDSILYQLREPHIAGLAGGLLQVPRAKFRPIDEAGQAKFSRFERNELLIAIGFRATQPIVHVQNNQVRTNLMQQVQECDGIRAAGNGYTQGLMIRQEVLTKPQYRGSGDPHSTLTVR